jgi:hypothetical protein
MPAQRPATDPPQLHRREWFSRLAVKLLGDNLQADMYDPMSIEDKLIRSANLGLINYQDIWGQNTSSPTLAAGANAGAAPPTPVLTAGATDTRGNVTCGTGTTPAAGALLVVTFGTPYAVAPIVQLTPTTVGSANLLEYVSNVSTTGFTISLQAAPAASQGNTVYGFNYRVS